MTASRPQSLAKDDPKLSSDLCIQFPLHTHLLDLAAPRALPVSSSPPRGQFQFSWSIKGSVMLAAGQMLVYQERSNPRECRWPAMVVAVSSSDVQLQRMAAPATELITLPATHW